MENMDNGTRRRTTPRRRKLKPINVLIKTYLPVLIVLVLIILFIIFAVGSVNRANERREQARQESIAEASSLAQKQADLEAEALRLIAQADVYAASCEFDKALEVLDSFSGNPDDFSSLVSQREVYKNGESTLVAWEDITAIPCLSFGKLISDPAKDFAGSAGEDNKYYYISTGEFTAILQQLYDNGYMLVNVDDIFETGKAEDGTTLITAKELRLPAGKKPVILVQCQAEGYENRLVLDANGAFTSEIAQEGGTVQTGAYDFVPLLEEFIASHPGFSYRSARAVLAVTGHNGLFGYELEDTTGISQVVTALRETGYTIAGNTFGNVAYGKLSLLDLQDDLAKWETSVLPLLGETEILVYARSSDISNEKDSYTSKKYEKLYGAGFRYYFGLCYNSTPWMNITDNTIRIGRLMVTGSNLESKSALFENLFDAAAVLDSNR